MSISVEAVEKLAKEIANHHWIISGDAALRERTVREILLRSLAADKEPPRAEGVEPTDLPNEAGRWTREDGGWDILVGQNVVHYYGFRRSLYGASGFIAHELPRGGWLKASSVESDKLRERIKVLENADKVWERTDVKNLEVIIKQRDECSELEKQVDALTEERDAAKRELAMWKPMSPLEAEAAYEAAEAIPLDEEEINEIVAKVTDPTYRPSEPEYVLMAATLKQQATEIEALRKQLAERCFRGGIDVRLKAGAYAVWRADRPGFALGTVNQHSEGDTTNSDCMYFRLPASLPASTPAPAAHESP